MNYELRITNYRLHCFLIIGIIFLLSACNNKKEIRNNSNMLFEFLLEGTARGHVKQIEYINSDLIIDFNCENHLESLSIPSEKIKYNYQYSGDTITNEVSKKTRTKYILGKQGKIEGVFFQSLNDEGKWISFYDEKMSYSKKGDLISKEIDDPDFEKKTYYISREEFNYYPNNKVEVLKYGKDALKNSNERLLRTETRIANNLGDWTTIAEVDEDGIPYRNASYHYEYDARNNWTQLIVQENNNYTGQSSIDTIQRNIIYYQRGDCK